MIDEHAQIGEVAARVGLSLRTIRYYEEIGLVMPSGRTQGGFRLYTEGDIERLRLVKALKPVGMSLETMQELLDLCDRPRVDDTRREELICLARARCAQLEQRVAAAREALDRLAAGMGGVGAREASPT